MRQRKSKLGVVRTTRRGRPPHDPVTKGHYVEGGQTDSTAEGVAEPGVKPLAILPELFLPHPALLTTYNLAALLVENI